MPQQLRRVNEPEPEPKLEVEILHVKHPGESAQEPGIDVYCDVVCLYKNVLMGYPNAEEWSRQLRLFLTTGTL